MHPRASFGAGRALGSRCDPMGAGVSVTAVLRAGTSALAAAFHADGTLLCFTIIHFSCGGMAGPYEWAAKLPSRVLFVQLVGAEVARRVSCGGPPDAILPAPRGRRAKGALGTFFSSAMNDRGSGESRWTRRGPRNASVAAMATTWRGCEVFVFFFFFDLVLEEIKSQNFLCFSLLCPFLTPCACHCVDGVLVLFRACEKNVIERAGCPI
ncbi:hypothetical protein ECC02_004106 [Trypanosoma cruzi]|uniref:Uncharacterized protein n=1 Tax=Trypanosoma cruzi TaxID=5693 RepID=A0A7J6Y8C1_TRYCR|nr:hypothetical protein ECC02_004103 [Trypanosoma cruzi]KAF5222775.1 hypothetical protein ECC02_004106 [Trypanosoma cruzi]